MFSLKRLRLLGESGRFWVFLRQKKVPKTARLGFGFKLIEHWRNHPSVTIFLRQSFELFGVDCVGK